MSTFAIRVTDDYGYDEYSVHGVDWTSTYAALRAIFRASPFLTWRWGMTGSWEYLASEAIYNNSKSADKTLALVAGATR